ncbi:MAG: hypothetical protein JNM17_19160 [Archangium sp.]|nr:hypothetical protein [Archangium sp.]
MKRLRPLGLVVGDEELPRTLLEACDEERLVGGLSISLRATPDEVAVWLANAMGGVARGLRLLDVRGDELEVQCGAVLHEKWKVGSVSALIARLNETFCDDDGVKWLVELGEFEGSAQVWALAPEILEVLLETSLLEGATNRDALLSLFDGC